MSGHGIAKHPDSRALVDSRVFQFGEIWTIRDGLLGIPDADRILQPPRKIRYSRPVVIVSNHDGNSDSSFPTVQVATLSTRTHLKRPLDLVLHPRDGVVKSCLLRPGTIQPVCKIDLAARKSILTEDKRLELVIQLHKFFGLDALDTAE